MKSGKKCLRAKKAKLIYVFLILFHYLWFQPRMGHLSWLSRLMSRSYPGETHISCARPQGTQSPDCHGLKMEYRSLKKVKSLQFLCFSFYSLDFPKKSLNSICKMFKSRVSALKIFVIVKEDNSLIQAFLTSAAEKT